MQQRTFKHILEKTKDVVTHALNTARLPAPVPNTTWKLDIQIWVATTAHGHAGTPELLLMCTRRLLNFAPRTYVHESPLLHKEETPTGGPMKRHEHQTSAQHTAQTQTDQTSSKALFIYGLCYSVFLSLLSISLLSVLFLCCSCFFSPFCTGP